MQDIQDRLYLQSSKGTNFTHLMEIITSENNILLAYRNIKKNSGSSTKGVDGKNGAKRCKRGKKGAKKEWVIVAYCCR